MNAAALLALVGALILSLLLNVELWRRSTSYRIQRDDARGKLKWFTIYGLTAIIALVYARRKREQ